MAKSYRVSRRRSRKVSARRSSRKASTRRSSRKVSKRSSRRLTGGSKKKNKKKKSAALTKTGAFLSAARLAAAEKALAERMANRAKTIATLQGKSHEDKKKLIIRPKKSA